MCVCVHFHTDFILTGDKSKGKKGRLGLCRKSRTLNWMGNRIAKDNVQENKEILLFKLFKQLFDTVLSFD